MKEEYAETFDIYDRKIGQATLESKEGYEFLVNHSKEIILVLNKRGKIIFANKSTLTIFGYSKEEITGLSITHFLTKNSIKKAFYALAQEFLGRPQPELEVQAKTKSGGIRYLNVAEGSSPIHANGKLIGITISASDITEQRKAMIELHESEKRYRELFDHVPVGLYRTTPDGKTLDANPALLRMLGYPDRESMLKGNTATDYANPEDHERWKTALEKNGVLEDFENKILRQDGKIIWVKDSARVVKDNKGRVLYYEGALVDFTERKKAEEELSYTVEMLRKNLGATIQAISTLVETRDPYTAGHQRRVADLARAIAKEMGLSQEQVDGIRTTGLIHDIGKVSVPAEILSKPGRLTELEFSMIKIHPQYGCEILKPVEFPGPVAQTVLQHHERIDGSGYPSGLKNEEILIEAKILAVADVVEAMISHRPYRPARSLDQALEEITKNSGALYDPKVVEVCLRLFVKKGFTFREEQNLKISPN